MDWGIERAKQDGRDIYLVSQPAGRALYLSAGFQELGDLDVFGVKNYNMIMRNSGNKDAAREEENV